MSKFCDYCGTPLQEGAKFCMGCGHPVNAASQAAEEPSQQPASEPIPQQQPEPPQQPRPQRQPLPPVKKGLFVKVFLITSLVAVLAYGAEEFYQYRHDKKVYEELTKDYDEQYEKLARRNKKESEKSSKMKLKYEMFFDEALPFPDFGEITENSMDHGTQTIRMDKISYAEFVEYCKLLESQPGWEPHEEDNVAHFPKDYNDKMQTMCVGDYHGLHVVVCYLSDSFIEGTDMPHFRLSVKKK